MSIKTYLVGGLAVVAVAAVVGFYKTEMARARAQGRVDVLAAQLETVQTDYQSFRQLSAERASTRARERARLQEQADSLAGELGLAQRRGHADRATIARLLAQSGTPDSISRTISATIGALEHENEVCSLAFKNCREMLNLADERAAELSTRAIKADSVILLQGQVIDNLEIAGRPNTLLPWAVAGVAIVLAGLAITL